MEKRHNIRIPLMILLLLSIIVISDSLPALAHKVTIFAWVEGDTIFSVSKFSGGRRAKNAQVLVYDREGKQLLEGRTDDKGEFSFRIPKVTDLKIVLNAATGHRAEWTIPESEIVQAVGLLEKKGGGGSSQPVGVGLSKAEMRELIEDSLKKELRPIKMVLTELQSKGPSLTEVIGGIGYILGLMGVAIYFKYRRKNRE